MVIQKNPDMPTVVPAKTYLADPQTTNLQLTASATSQTEENGTRQYIQSAGKPLFLVFKGVQAKMCEDKRKKALLVLNPDENQELIAVLNDVRSRLIQQLSISEDQMRPILSTPASYLRKRSTLFLNLHHNATFKDQEKKEVDYASVLNKTCKLGVFVIPNSVFRNAEDGKYSLRLYVIQMILLERPTEVVSVDQSEVAPLNDDVEQFLQ